MRPSPVQMQTVHAQRTDRVLKMALKYARMFGSLCFKIIEILHHEHGVARDLAHGDEKGDALLLPRLKTNEGEVVAIEVPALVSQILLEGHSEDIVGILTDHPARQGREIEVLAPLAHDGRLRSPGPRCEPEDFVKVLEIALADRRLDVVEHRDDVILLDGDLFIDEGLPVEIGKPDVLLEDLRDLLELVFGRGHGTRNRVRICKVDERTRHDRHDSGEHEDEFGS